MRWKELQIQRSKIPISSVKKISASDQKTSLIKQSLGSKIDQVNKLWQSVMKSKIFDLQNEFDVTQGKLGPF